MVLSHCAAARVAARATTRKWVACLRLGPHLSLRLGLRLGLARVRAQLEEQAKSIRRDFWRGKASLAVGVFVPILERACAKRHPEWPADIFALCAADVDTRLLVTLDKLARGAGTLCFRLVRHDEQPPSSTTTLFNKSGRRGWLR
eukprot:scaffold41942_cov76-Phaeocystis_antarctica.AAC.6